ncbi:ATP-binding cassette domain-containing protein [Oceanobacter mangrovi]|uniref:phosphatase domain-containing putative toxin n=1 Tax=Oceanobacter mangrovi TaxID=2862510 RepID=UPI001C8F0F10|nr:ATP-binding cassette domain-containing protein [Oceanobacter mangrovi]
MDKVLSLAGFGVGIGERTILGSIDMDIGARGVTCLFGPSGSGKSTLLRTLAGLNDGNPNLRTWGSALYLGRPLGSAERPGMVVQSARLLAANVLQNVLYEVPERHSLGLAQQRDLATRLLQEWQLPELVDKLNEAVINLDLATSRCLAILRICAASSPLICLDEPTARLNQQDARKVLDVIRLQAEKRSVLLTLHNQEHAEYLDGQSVLMAGGFVRETAASRALFKAPQTELAATFARTGSCCVPSPDSRPEELEPGSLKPLPLPAAAGNYVSDSFGPRGFQWIIKGVLAGTPRPGVFHDEEYDIKSLKQVEISHLITLTEPPPKEASVNQQLLARYGIGNSCFPIPDMRAPTCQQAVAICQTVDQLLAANERVAVHCKAGMGRTGTILCTYLIWQGHDAISALEQARNIEPRWVQSEAQVAFLEAFASDLKSLRKELMNER